MSQLRIVKSSRSGSGSGPSKLSSVKCKMSPVGSSDWRPLAKKVVRLGELHAGAAALLERLVDDMLAELQGLTQ